MCNCQSSDAVNAIAVDVAFEKGLIWLIDGFGTWNWAKIGEELMWTWTN